MNNLEFKKDKNKYYLAITGHADIESAFADNKEEIGYNSETFNKVETYIDEMINAIIKYKNVSLQNIVFISGMARGVDEIFAIYAVKHKLSLQLFVPNSVNWHQFRDLRANGTRAQAYDYQYIVDYVKEKNTLGDYNSQIFEIRKEYNGELYKFANFARNQAMVDNCDNLISVLVNSSSGTEDCIKRGKDTNKYLGNCITFKQNQSVIDFVAEQYSKGYTNISDTNLFNTLNLNFNTDLFNNNLNLNVIAHGANCMQTMGSGIAFWIKKTYPEAYEADLNYSFKNDRNKLGTYSIARVKDNSNKQLVYIANLYTQFSMYDKDDRFDVKHLESSLKLLFNDLIKARSNKHKENALNIPIKIGIPPIGLGLANGNPKDVFNMLVSLSKEFEKENIKLHFCIHPKDINLNNTFKSYVNEFKQLQIQKEQLNLK